MESPPFAPSFYIMRIGGISWPLLTRPDSDSLLVMRNMTFSPLQSIARAVQFLLVAGCLALPAIAVAADGTDNFKAFVGARIIDGTGKPAMEKATLLVKNGRIVAVGRSVKLPA